jgi:hypothetical protein
MARSVLVGKVAALAREIDRSNHIFGEDELPNLASSEDAGSGEEPQASTQLSQDTVSEPQTPGTSDNTLRAKKRRKLISDDQDDSARRILLDELLGDWDDVPDINTVDVSMLCYRHAVEPGMDVRTLTDLSTDSRKSRRWVH